LENEGKYLNLNGGHSPPELAKSLPSVMGKPPMQKDMHKYVSLQHHQKPKPYAVDIN